MFKKPKTAIISVEQNGEIKQATTNLTSEPQPVQLTVPVSVDKLTIAQTSKGIVIAAGNDNEIINIEVKG